SGVKRAERLSGRLLVHRSGGRSVAANGLDRAFDRCPQLADLAGCATFCLIFAGAFTLAECEQEIRTIGDLTRPHRSLELGDRFAAATISLTLRFAIFSGGSFVPRSLCQSVNEPCGSASISKQGFVPL